MHHFPGHEQPRLHEHERQQRARHVTVAQRPAAGPCAIAISPGERQLVVAWVQPGDGALVLGTWQSIYLWEHRMGRHERKITVSVIGE